MSSQNQLEQLRQMLKLKSPGTAESLLTTGREMMDKPRPAVSNLLEHFAGEFLEFEEGRFFRHRKVFQCTDLCGHHPISHLAELSASDLCLPGQSLFTESDNRPVAFLDTETTGLAGGTGTYAFLIGIGYWENNQFIVDQYFMCDYEEELPMLLGLIEEYEKFSSLVTYNGRTFDMPLLRSRFRMNRLKPVLDEIPHLDLLGASRRLWSKWLDSCSLSFIEQEILGVQRVGDIPGHLIPKLYFDFLRRKDPKPLKPVFYHNAQDILSLAMLTWRVCRMVRGPLVENLSPMEIFSVGRWMELSEDIERAVECYETIREKNFEGEVVSLARNRLACLHKKNKDFDKAQPLWEEALGGPHEKSLYEVFRDYAIYLEHTAKDYKKAIALVREALDRLDLERQLHRSDRDMDLSKIVALGEKFQYRLARLMRKQSKANEGVVDIDE